MSAHSTPPRGPMSPLVAYVVPVLVLAASCAPVIDPNLSVLQEEVFGQSCAFESCHGGPNPQSGLDFNTAATAYETLVDVESEEADGGIRVVPGDPEGSVLYQVLLGSVGESSQMPVADQLPNNEIEGIRQWIEDGAAND